MESTPASTLRITFGVFPCFRGRHDGGGNKEGVENLTNDTHPKRGFWTPLRTVRFPPPLRCQCCVFLYKNPLQSRPEALLEGSKKLSGERVLWYVFLSPIRFAPPISRAKFSTRLPGQEALKSTAIGQQKRHYVFL